MLHINIILSLSIGQKHSASRVAYILTVSGLQSASALHTELMLMLIAASSGKRLCVALVSVRPSVCLSRR